MQDTIAGSGIQGPLSYVNFQGRAHDLLGQWSKISVQTENDAV